MLVMFAAFASVAILMSAFALSVGSWFAHKRHLQVQADAAVLAAAQAFQYPCAKTVKEAIYSTAGRYGGAASVDAAEEGTFTSATPLYNEQIGGTSQGDIHERVNKKKYFGQSAEDNTVEKAPCEPQANMIDVKLTETNLPWFFKAANVPFINAHARVSILQETSASGIQPLAVADTAPIAAKAYFVNEDSANAVIAESKLERASNGRGWSSEKPVGVKINKTKGNEAHIGVIIALSGNETAPKAGGTIATKCAEAYIQCFDNSATGPLLHVAGYTLTGAGTVKKPLARPVRLWHTAPATCPDSYFSNSPSNCKVTIEAKLDYGGPTENGASTNEHGMTITATVGNSLAATLTYSKEKAAWIGQAELTTGSGSNAINVKVNCKKEPTSPCPAANEEGSATNVQRIYAASAAHSGPILAAKVFEPSASETPVPRNEGADSYEVCEKVGAKEHEGQECEPQLEITIETEGSLADAANCESEAACKAAKAGFFDNVRNLKFEGNGGVIYECIPGENASTKNYRDHLREGCQFAYKLNEKKEGAFSDPNCTAKNPYDCIAVGLKGNHNGARSAVAERFEGATKPPGTNFYCHNLWQNTNNGKVPAVLANDSRIVQVFVIPYGALNENGEPTGGLNAVPIEHFATFYVTGYTNDACALTKKETEEQWVEDDSAPGFEIVGHFIKYVNVLGGSNGAKCKSEASAIDTCVATLTE